MTSTILRDLYLHMEWADALVWRETRAAQRGSRDEVLFQTLLHLHTAQRAFLMAWRHESLDGLETEQFTTYEALQSWVEAYYPLVTSYLSEIADDALNSLVELPWAPQVEGRLGRSPGPTTLGETLYQVAAHSTYHRGQVNRRLREIGGEPPLVDYIAWVWLGRPSAEWHE